MKYMSLLSLICISCSHAPKDIADNYAVKGYMNTEFQSQGKTFLGILPFNLNSTTAKELINYVGIGEGTTKVSSLECGLNYSQRFTTSTVFKVEDFTKGLKPCVIYLNSITDPIKNIQHDITEIGAIYLTTLPAGYNAAKIGYSERGEFGIKEVSSLQSVAIQRAENTSETIFISTSSESGTMVVTNSCGEPSIHQDYNSKDTLFSFDELYKLTKKTCIFNFILLPNDELKPYFATMFVNIFAKDVTQLEHIPYKIKGKNVVLQPASYIWAASINDKLNKMKYEQDKEYTIRGLTSNGRKSVYIMKNNQIIWW